MKLALAALAWGTMLSWALDCRAVQVTEQPKTAAPAAETKKPAPAPPAAIPASEIIPRSEQTLKALQETRIQVATDSAAALNSMQKDIDAFAEKADRRWQEERETLGKSRSLQRLNDVLRTWSLEQSQLDSWDRSLARRSQTLVSQEKDISRIIDTWQATRAAGNAQELPTVAVQKIAEVLREADAMRTLIRENMAKLLNLQSQLSSRREIITKIRSDIDQAREESGRRLFVLDSPPLWKALFRAEAQDAIVIEAIQSSQRFAEDLQEFPQKYGDRILWHTLFFVAVLILLRFLRQGMAPQAAERLGAPAATFLVQRPFAVAFLLALIATPLFYRGAPVAVLRIAALPAVIPLIRLLPGLAPRTSWRWLDLFVAIYVLDFVRYLLPLEWLLTRVLLSLIAAGGCIGLAVFLRSRAAELSNLRSRGRLVLAGARLGLLLFAISVASNLVGNLTLAELLVAAPLRITYAAILISAGAQLLQTVIVVALQSAPARALRSVRKHGELIAFRLRALIRLLAVAFWASLSLVILGVLGDVWDAAADFFQLRWKVGAAEISMQNVALFIAVLAGAVLLSRMLRFALTEEILPRIPLPRGVPGAVDVLSRYGILLLGFFIALAAAGVDLSKVTLLVSALGVGIGFGLQGIVNNFVSGLILVFEHPVQVGDFVEVGTTSGEVQKIGFRASVLRTPDGAEVIIPNGELVGARFTNWSLSDRLRRIGISVGVAYGTDPDRVIGMLLEVARKHPAVLAEPAPSAVFDRFGDSALNFTLFCWSVVDKWFIARSELTVAINNAFKEAGVNIPFPQQDVHVHLAAQPDVTPESIEPSKEAAESAENPTVISKMALHAKR